jgi:hypothetical protein
VRDAATDGRHVFVISSRTPGFAVLSPQLEVRRVVGTRGNAVGQFVQVEAIRVAPDGHVMVLDAYLRRLYTYAVRGDSVSLAGTLGLPAEMYDFVPKADGTVWVIGAYRGHRLHRIARNGNVLESRWPLDVGLSEELQTLRAQRYALTSLPDGLLAASPWHPFTETVHLPSARVERARLAGFRRVESRDKGNGYEIRSGPAGSTQPRRAMRLSDGTTLLQADVVTRVDDGDARTLQWSATERTPTWQGPMPVPYRLLALQDDRALVQYMNAEATIGVVTVRRSSP